MKKITNSYNYWASLSSSSHLFLVGVLDYWSLVHLYYLCCLELRDQSQYPEAKVMSSNIKASIQSQMSKPFLCCYIIILYSPRQKRVTCLMNKRSYPAKAQLLLVTVSSGMTHLGRTTMLSMSCCNDRYFMQYRQVLGSTLSGMMYLINGVAACSYNACKS